MGLGMGVMIGILGGNEKTVKSVKFALGKTIKSVFIQEEGGLGGTDNLVIVFEEGNALILWDGGQSCCEHRYMKSDDDLGSYTGQVIKDITIKEGSYDEDNEWGDVHEIQFLEVVTDKDVFQVSNHNQHNGYYGGFWIQADLMEQGE